MDEQAVLHHLIEVEKNAAQIVDNAKKQTAAAIAENDRSCRAEFETALANNYAALEAAYKQTLAEIDGAYQEKLAAQRALLEQKPPNEEKFRTVLHEYLFSKSRSSA